MTTYDSTTAMANAQARTGLENFGSEAFREPLDVLIDAMTGEADLTDDSLQRQFGDLVRALQVRLRAQAFLDQYPEIADERVRPDLVIVGPQRTGTSKLFRMLAADDRWTKLWTWQAFDPIPPSAPPLPQPDPRIATAEAFVEKMRWLQPAHEMDAHAPEMEAVIMAQGFMTNSPTRIVPSHQRYCAAADHAPVYEWLHLMLQLIQWQNGGPRRPWILKSPTHLPTLRELNARYPETVLVMTHRHPVVSLASMFKLVELGTQNHARRVDRGRIRDFWLRILLLNMERLLAFRDDATATAHWVDVSYSELSKDSLAAVRLIYDALGIDVTDEAVAMVETWEQRHPQHAAGEFSYRLEDYGMTEADVAREFAGYISRFGDLF
jgi:hypothetical protein